MTVATSRTRLVAMVPVTVLAMALAGCGDQRVAELPADAADEVPITPRTLAALVADGLDLEVTGARETSSIQRLGRGAVAADVRLAAGAGEGDDGDLVRVWVTPDTGDLCAEYEIACETSQTDAGRLSVAWEKFYPEEDPGYVVVALTRADETVLALYAGDNVTGDPREQDDLAVSVDDLTGLVSDPRLSLLTSEAVVEAAAAYEPWYDGS